MKSFLEFRKRILKVQRDGLQRKPSLPVDAPEKECLNCGTHFCGRFCPECGQAASTRRLAVKDMVQSIFATLVAGDNVFFRTAGALLFRPGYMVRDYLYGRRVRYFKPVQMLVRLVAVFVLLSYLFDREYSVITFMSEDIMHDHIHSESLMRAIRVLSILLNNKAIYSLLLALISVLPFKLAFLGCRFNRPGGTKAGLNIAEHYYTLVYLSCLNLIVSILLTPFSSIETVSSLLNGFTLPLLLVFSSTIYAQIFDLNFFKSILRSLLGIIFTALFTAGIVILTFGLFYGIDAVN